MPFVKTGVVQVSREITKAYSAILSGLRISHNFVRPHQGLPDRATTAGIDIRGDNKFLTLIQAAKSYDPAV